MRAARALALGCALGGVIGAAGLASSGCDWALGYDEQHDYFENLKYCDCFSDQGIEVEERCRDGFDELVDGVGESVTITTMSELAASCSRCSDDPAVLVSCYEYLPDLKDEDAPCESPSECKSLACCADLTGPPLEETGAKCCAQCTGCGDQLTVDDKICKDAGTQVVAVIDEVKQSDKEDAGCSKTMAVQPDRVCDLNPLTVTLEGAIACYNCLAAAGLLEALCGENPSRPVVPE